MINFGEILKKAWKLLWNYRVLWIFGVLLAVTAGTAGGGRTPRQMAAKPRIPGGQNRDRGAIGELRRLH